MRSLQTIDASFHEWPVANQNWRPLLGAHLLRLGPASRRNRFLVASPDAAMLGYADKADPARLIFARVDGLIRGCAEIHLIRQHGEDAEIALSVEDPVQNQGIGTALFNRALAKCGDIGVRNVWIYFHCGNQAMRRISDRAGFQQSGDMISEVCQMHATLPHFSQSA